jgi:ribosomal-protein-alanine N-acetyltransferase
MTIIQPASLRDLFAVAALERACFGSDAWGLLELVIALLAPGVRLKVMAGDRLIGFAVGEARAREREGWIATLAIHPDYQRRGLGRQLLAAVEAHLPAPTLKLTVRVSNTPAIALYEQAGYRPVNRIARYYSGGEDGMVMERRR